MTIKTPTCTGDIDIAEAGGILSIDLDALASNWRYLRDAAGRAECSAVVKANAYGIGIEHVVPVLSAAGCRTFFVAHLSEAVRVRRCAPDASIFVLNGLLPGTAGIYADHNLFPILGSRAEISEWSSFCSSSHRKLPAALHVDTGMSRLGISPAEAAELSRTIQRQDCELRLLMSHFIASEDTSLPANQKQIDAFEEIIRLFLGIPASLANSSGIFLPQKPHFQMVRPGYALYGGNPSPGKPNPMKPVVRLEGRIVQLRSVPAGTSVGYNSRWTSQDERRLATISVGYADGYPRSASGTDEKREHGRPAGAAIVAGKMCPFVGTVSMDLIVIDISAVPPEKIRPGDLVTLIGDALTIDKVGENAGTIGYEILTNLGKRYACRYFGDGKSGESRSDG